MAKEAPRLGAGGTAAGPGAAVSQTELTHRPRTCAASGSRFTSGPLIKSTQLAPPGPGVPSGRAHSHGLRGRVASINPEVGASDFPKSRASNVMNHEKPAQ